MNDGFTTNGSIPRAAKSIVVSLDELHPFPNQPFKVVHDEALESLVESIRANGLINRIIIRPRHAGGYEIIAGHRRVEAFRLLGFDTIAADLRTDLDDDSAVLTMIETNLRQRPKLLPSERGWAYRMMRDSSWILGIHTPMGGDDPWLAVHHGTFFRDDHERVRTILPPLHLHSPSADPAFHLRW